MVSLAEQALEQFQAQIHPYDGLKRTVSTVTICKSMGARRADYYDWSRARKVIRFRFSDGSQLEVSGRGLAHQAEVIE